ncbi:hypothetical protein FDI24_gp029 [Acidovorax phage ACP17]|uniref:Uncharacterized protein n=1 Tax=Acidovorax phage ACP17 TaxID=2010329 RepID=A0A218M3D4_9CAUD|nr:hypothetical protein FDI24_gp029 [Acidovorax phage ACP17]ASD50563.1 hypothetical protein [Acidovorax phage ACP17]
MDKDIIKNLNINKLSIARVPLMGVKGKTRIIIADNDGHYLCELPGSISNEDVPHVVAEIVQAFRCGYEAGSEAIRDELKNVMGLK